MKKLAKKVFKIILPLILGGTILAWVYRDFDFVEAAKVLVHGMNWWWMLFSLFFGVMSHLFRGWRWMLALEPMGASPKRANCVYAVFVSYATNLIIPRLGEVSRCGILSKYDDISFSKSLGTVVTERLIDSLCVLLITGFALVTQLDAFQSFFAQTGTRIESITQVFTSMQFYIILFSLIGVIILLYFLARTLSFFEKVKGVVLNIWEGAISLKKAKHIPFYIVYTLLIWFCYFMQFYLAFYCFDFTANLGIEVGLVLFVAGTLSVIVPTPNGAGPWHFAIISMLVLYGVNSSDAGIFALLVHGIQTLLIIILGIYAFVALPLVNKTNTL